MIGVLVQQTSLCTSDLFQYQNDEIGTPHAFECSKAIIPLAVENNKGD